jgi:hypothetical protein
LCLFNIMFITPVLFSLLLYKASRHID